MEAEPQSDWRWQWSYPYGVATCPRQERWYHYRGRSFVVKRYRGDAGRIRHYSVLPNELPYGWHGCFTRSLAEALQRAVRYLKDQPQETTHGS